MPDREITPTDLPPVVDRPAGVVLGSEDAGPLEFWIGVHEEQLVQLDDLVVVEAQIPGGGRATFYGIVDQVRKRYEGAEFDTDAFRAAAGVLPVEVSYAGHVQTTRIEPEVFMPPDPGTPVRVVHGEDFQKALYIDRMERKIPIGMTRTGEPIYANLEFLDGTRGAHASISGVSGVATKTSYATFLLYSLFHCDSLGLESANTKAIIFNVKGEDLLWLDRPNARLRDEDRLAYARLGLPAGPFQSVGLFAPVRRRSDVPMPDTGSRHDGVTPYCWTLRDFARDRLLRFAFSDAEDARSQIGFVVTQVERELERAAQNGDPHDPGIELRGARLTTFGDLVESVSTNLDGMTRNAAPATLDAFRRRLHAAAGHMGHLVRGDAESVAARINWDDHQVTVIDIHKLHGTAQMFVVGVVLKRMMERKEAQGTTWTVSDAWLDNGTLATAGTMVTNSLTIIGTATIGSDGSFWSFLTSLLEGLYEAWAFSLLLVAAAGYLAGALAPVLGDLLIGGTAIAFGFPTGQALYAIGTGLDPKTGRELSNAEQAAILGGLLGSLVGAKLGGAQGERVAEYLTGERCGIFSACFEPDTPMLATLDGASKPINDFRSYEQFGDACDWIVSKDEHNPDAPLVMRRVLRKFERLAQVLNVHVRDRIIGTTANHPFFVLGKGWLPAGALQIGDAFVSDDGKLVVVEGIADSGQVRRVVNLEVEGDHTYFVGTRAWGFSAWAHNMTCEVEEALENGEINRTSRQRAGVLTEAEQNPQHHLFPKEERAWFADRGINVDDHTITIDRGLHDALHAGGGPRRGGGWWNKEMMRQLKAAEAKLPPGQTLSPSQILNIRDGMLRRFNLDGIPILPYGR